MGRPQSLSLSSAVSTFVEDGATVLIGNFGAQLHCVGHELIRRRRRGLHLVMGSGGILLDQLIGMRVPAAVTFSHCWSPVGPAPAWNFRRLAESEHTVELDEVTVGMLAGALQAAAWRVPFIPTSNLAGTVYADPGDSPARLAWVDSPFGGSWVTKAIAPDVAFIHADAVDPDGNAAIVGPAGEAPLAAAAAERTVVVAEELLDREAFRARAADCVVPGLLVDAYVVQPGAVWPDGAMGRYPRDLEEYEAYSEAARSEDGFRAWIDEHVLRADSVGGGR